MVRLFVTSVSIPYKLSHSAENRSKEKAPNPIATSERQLLAGHFVTVQLTKKEKWKEIQTAAIHTLFAVTS